MQRHCENAMKVALALENHPKVSWVKYPFLKSHPQYDIAIQANEKSAAVLFALK
jgi:O-succinylhomoserine sulfhydrylase